MALKTPGHVAPRRAQSLAAPPKRRFMHERFTTLFHLHLGLSTFLIFYPHSFSSAHKAL